MAAAASHPTLHGRCLCGAITLAIDGAAGALVYCHCGQCRKTAGAPFQAVLPFAASAVEVRDPGRSLRAFASSAGKQRYFCGRCGSPIMSRREGSDSVRVRAGILDDLPADSARGGHIFCADRAAWDVIDDGQPQHAGIEPGRAATQGAKTSS